MAWKGGKEVRVVGAAGARAFVEAERVAVQRRRQQRRESDPRRDAIHPDPVAGPLAGQRLGQLNHRCLGHGVDSAAAGAGEAGDAADVDNCRPLGAFQEGVRFLGTEGARGRALASERA